MDAADGTQRQGAQSPRAIGGLTRPTIGITGCCARAANGQAAAAPPSSRDELAAPHSITSSAVESSVGGTIQPMAKRLALGECDQLHHFIAAGVWAATPVETELLIQADRLVGGDDAVLVIDDTAIPKKGTHSVGKTANCQTLVSLALARGEVPVMLTLRLFLPESWNEQSSSTEASGCSNRISNGADEAGAGSGGNRSCDHDRCALRLRAGGCRLWAKRAVPPGADSSQTDLGGRYSAASQGLPCRCADDLAAG